MIQLEDKLYTSTEVADILGVSLRSVYRYLEEDKLKAEVKTATGRHRFSKKNILDFLYPNGKDSAAQVTSEEKVIKQEKAVAKRKTPVKEEVVEAEEPVEEPTPVAKKEEVQPEEPIDWLAKFREAAQKYREEAEATQKEPMTMAEKTQIVEEEPSFIQNIAEEQKQPTTQKQFYRSSLGGLKDIAQNIDRGSRNSYLDYAFTMSAGLSLYKPIKPFSMLHAYVRPGDLTFFEKLLSLSPSDESNAQLCLLLSEDNDIYKSKEELHGLYVVSKTRLLSDIQEMGDSTLAAEASSILK